MKIEVLTPTIEQGNIGSSGNYDSTSRVRSKDYLYFENIAAPVKSVTITAQSTSNKTILVDLLGYTSNSTSSPTFDLYWYENGHVFDVTEYNAVKYFRVVLKYEDNSDISPSEIISVSVNLSYGYKWIQGADGHPVPSDAPDLPEKAMTKPYPLALWRIDPTANDGYPFTGLMPYIQSINLWIQPSRPLIHVYGHTQQSFDKNMFDFDGNGYAIIEPISCEVRHEENGEYSLSMEVCCDEYGKYKYLKKQSLIKVPIRYHGIIKWQIFRIIIATRYTDENGMGMVRVNATHLFYDNNRYLIKYSRPTQKNGEEALGWIFKNGEWYGNEKQSYPFTYASNITSIRTAYYENMSPTTALLGADQCFINRWGGRLYRDNYYFSINKEMENSQNVGIIQYGFNMTEIEFTEDDTNLITDLIAVDNFGNEYQISNSTIPNNTIPHRIYQYVKFSYDKEDVNAFHADAQAYYDEYKQSSVNITVQFVNLTDTELYKEFLMLDNFEVGDKVTVYHKELDIYFSNLEIISKTYDVVAQQTTEVEIGNFKSAISRRSFMSETVSDGQSAVNKQLEANRQEFEEIAFITSVKTPITTVDGKFLTTSDGKYLLYKE